MKLCLTFWPVLIVLGLPTTFSLYFEKGDPPPSYPTREACAARLPELDQEARKTEGFLASLRALNHSSDLSNLIFSRECTDKPPPDLYDEMLRHTPPKGA